MSTEDHTLKEEDLVPYKPKADIHPPRVTVQSNLYFQAADEDPIQVKLDYVEFLKSDEEPFSKRYNVASEPIPLIPKHSWVEDPGTIVVTNLAGKLTRAVNPSTKELQDELKSVITVGVIRDGKQLSMLEILPKCSVILKPVCPEIMTLYSLTGLEIPFRVHVFPR